MLQPTIYIPSRLTKLLAIETPTSAHRHDRIAFLPTSATRDAVMTVAM
jgi:hypothetical protein